MAIDLDAMIAYLCQSGIVNESFAKEMERLRRVEAAACASLGVPQRKWIDLMEGEKLCRSRVSRVSKLCQP